METAESMVLGGIKNAIVEGNHKDMAELMKKALDLGYKPELILNEYMIAAMVEVGNRFEAHEAFIPEMMLAAKAMTVGLGLQGLMDLCPQACMRLYPLIMKG